MAFRERPRSIYEKATSPALPASAREQKTALVTQGQRLIDIDNAQRRRSEYDPNGWRELALANRVRNPATFSRDFEGKAVIVPPAPLPDFE